MSSQSIYLLIGKIQQFMIKMSNEYILLSESCQSVPVYCCIALFVLTLNSLMLFVCGQYLVRIYAIEI